MTEGKTVQNSDRDDGFCGKSSPLPATVETAVDSASACFGSSRIEMISWKRLSERLSPSKGDNETTARCRRFAHPLQRCRRETILSGLRVVRASLANCTSGSKHHASRQSTHRNQSHRAPAT